MSLVDFFRIAANHWKLMMMAGAILGTVVFLGTRNEKKEYSSHTLINTGLVSGYNLESSESKVDYAYTNNEIENLISLASSHETMEELAIRMLARYICLTVPDSNLVTLEGWEELKTEAVDAVRKLVAVPGDEQKTLERIMTFRNGRTENEVLDLVYSGHPFFGLEQLKKTIVMREGKSDMLRFKYATIDPLVCRQTLVLLTEIFTEKHRRSKQMQSTDVLEFFEKATQEAQATLNAKEDALLAFMVTNKIINYYEQTRFIAAKKEDLDEMYFKELMQRAAADSSLQRLEAEMGKHLSVQELNNRLSDKRAELSNVTARLAQAEVFTLDSLPVNSSAVEFLRRQANTIKSDIKNTAATFYAVNRTPEGLEVKNLLSQWLNQIIGIEQAVARLNVLNQRKKEFDAIYSKFAPWGSQLKRMEREIDVAEKAYLENLHSYNQARLHQYNMVISSNLRVVDPPYMPLKPADSKRMMLVALAFIVGFILTLGAAVALEMIDNTLKSPVRAAEVVGLPVNGAFPRFPETTGKREKIDYGFIRERSVGQLLQHVMLDLRQQGVRQGVPARVAVVSTRREEGKSFLTRQLVEKIRSGGERVAYLYPGDPAQSIHPDDKPYRVDYKFFEKKTEAALLDDPKFNPNDYDFIYLELPGLLTEAFPVDLAARYDLSLLVTRANRVWNAGDKKALDSFVKSAKTAPRIALNAVRPENLEASLGEIPKRRSRLRKFGKRIVMLDFSGKKSV